MLGQDHCVHSVPGQEASAQPPFLPRCALCRRPQIWVELAQAPWCRRDGHAAVAAGGSVFVLGGAPGAGGGGAGGLGDTWRSDDARATWRRVDEWGEGFAGRWRHGAVAHRGSLFVLGGWGGGGCLGDVWQV